MKGDAEGTFFVADLPGFGTRILINGQLDVSRRCKQLPGARWNPVMRAWHLPATAGMAAQVERAMLGVTRTTDAGYDALVAQAAHVHSAQAFKEMTDLPDTPTRTSAWLHQRRAFAFATDLDAVMLAMDMGTGKSMVSIALHQQRDVRSVLILAPVSVVGVWAKQFLIHALDPDEWMVMPVATNKPIRTRVDQVARAFINMERRSGRRLVVVVNYEAAWRPGMKELLTRDWDAVVLDESHRTKAAGGKASLMCNGLHRHARYRMCLTGTPMPHSPGDIYAQYRFLDPGIFGSSKNRFQNRYAVMRQIKAGVNIIEGWQNMDEFNEKFASIAFVVDKSDALPDLPEKMPPIERTFNLGPKGLFAYNALARDFVAEVEQGTIIATNALTRVMRFRQITSGYAPTMEGTVAQVDEGREKLLLEVLEDLDEPVVVFAAFHHDLDAIARVCEKLRRSYGELSGRRRDGLNPDSTMAAVDVLACQIKSGGVGIDLTRSSIAVYYSIGYELGDFLQSQDRLHRPGQTRPVRYVHLIAENAPIDRVMLEALEGRLDVVQAVLTAAKAKELGT